MSSASHPVDGERYVELLRVLGRGGFGAVYLADLHGRDDFVQRVAVKVLNERMTASADIAARQRDEARLLARLNHDHIVKVFDLTEVRQRPTVIMEYVEGVDLGQLVREAALPPKVALQAIGQAASALQAAWESADPQSGKPLRVVHRDIKPSNLLLSRHGTLKVLDFGIARGDFDREGATGSVQFGTSRFMAPEQWLYQAVSDKVDVYALGVTLVELLAGAALERAPLAPERFRMHMDAAIQAVVSHELPSSTQPLIADLCRRMLAFEPDDRPTAAEVRESAMVIVDDLSGEGLVRFARRTVPPLLERSLVESTHDPLLTPSGDDRSTHPDPGISVRRLTPLPNPTSFTPSASADPTFAFQESEAAPATGPFTSEPARTASTLAPSPSATSSPVEDNRPLGRSWWTLGSVLVAGVLGAMLIWVAAQLGPALAPPARETLDPAPPVASAPPAFAAKAPSDKTTTDASEPPPKARPDDAPRPARASNPTTTPTRRNNDSPAAAPANAPSRAEPSSAPPPSAQPTRTPPVEPEPKRSPQPPPSAPVPAAPPDSSKAEATPKPLPGSSGIALTFTSTPIGASVTVDGRLLPSSTPARVSLPRGTHTLKIEKDGQQCTTSVAVSTLSAKTLRCDLATQTLHTVR